MDSRLEVYLGVRGFVFVVSYDLSLLLGTFRCFFGTFRCFLTLSLFLSTFRCFLTLSLFLSTFRCLLGPFDASWDLSRAMNRARQDRLQT